VEPTGECEVTHNDLDGDEHLDPGCASPTNPPTLPIDDCDDTKGSVYPGASEICDGLDNDCNLKTDFGDGLLLSGASADFVVSPAIVRQPAITWSPTETRYGVVWQDLRMTAGDEEIYFALMSPNGQMVGTEIRVSEEADESARPRVAWGNGSFGVVWNDSRNGNLDIYFRQLDATGNPVGTEKQLTTDTAPSEYADIVSIPDGWLVAFVDKISVQQVYGIRLALDGTIVKAKTLIGTQTGKHDLPRLAVAGNQLGMTWSRVGSTTQPHRIGFVQSDFDFNVAQQIDLSPVSANNTGGIVADISANSAGDGYLTAYYNLGLSQDLSYGELESDGGFSCGPESVSSSAVVGMVGEIVPYANGSTFLFTTGGGAAVQMLIGIFESGCGTFYPGPLETAGVGWSDNSPSNMAAAAGESGVAMVWADEPNQRIRVRAMGPHLCD
jgi:hypothetical protein